MIEMNLTYNLIDYKYHSLFWKYDEYFKNHKDGVDNGYTNLKYLFQDRVSNCLEVTSEIAEEIANVIDDFCCVVYQVSEHCRHLYIYTHQYVSGRGTKLGEKYICRVVLLDDESTIEWYNNLVFKNKLLAAVLMYLAERILDVNGFVEEIPCQSRSFPEKKNGVKIGSMLEKDGQMGLVSQLPVQLRVSNNADKLFVTFTDKLEIE